MKTPKMKLTLKIFCLFTVFFFFSKGNITAQCYQDFLDKGISSYQSFNFEQAIKQFKAAQICEDEPRDGVVEEWLEKAQGGYIIRLKNMAARYLTAEAQQAFNKEDYRLSLRLSQEALKLVDAQPAKKLQEKTLNYAADYQQRWPINETRYQSSKLLQSSRNTIIRSSYSDLQLINLENQQVLHRFSFRGDLRNYQLSENEKYLLAQVKIPLTDRRGPSAPTRMDCLLWDLDSGQLLHTFENVFVSALMNQVAVFSENSQRIALRINTSFGEKNAYRLSIYDLKKQSEIYTTVRMEPPLNEENSDRENSTRQEVLRSKIETKFELKGNIATNPDQFLPCANVFSIRPRYDFVLSPDGDKLAYVSAISGSSELELRIIENPADQRPQEEITVIDINKGEKLLKIKSNWDTNLKQFTRFDFDKTGKYLLSITEESASTNGDDFNLDTQSRKKLKVYDLAENQLWKEVPDVNDYYLDPSNQVVFAGGSKRLVQLQVLDLQNGQLYIDEQPLLNLFSHIYDLSIRDGELYYSTFNRSRNKSQLHRWAYSDENASPKTIFDSEEEYSYQAWRADLERLAILTTGAKTIVVKNTKTKSEILRIQSQHTIEEVSFSKEGKYLLLRNNRGLIQLVKLQRSTTPHNYFDQMYAPISPEEKQRFGIDWQ